MFECVSQFMIQLSWTLGRGGMSGGIFVEMEQARAELAFSVTGYIYIETGCKMWGRGRGTLGHFRGPTAGKNTYTYP